MRIGELAKRSGLSTSRIRFYEANGLLNTVERQANGYREYSAETLVTLEIITHAQKVGFTLDEIRGLLPADLFSWQHDKLIAALRHKLAELEAMEQRLAENKARLLALIRNIENPQPGADCAANAKRVLNHMLQQGGTVHDRKSRLC